MLSDPRHPPASLSGTGAALWSELCELVERINRDGPTTHALQLLCVMYSARCELTGDKHHRARITVAAIDLTIGYFAGALTLTAVVLRKAGHHSRKLADIIETIEQAPPASAPTPSDDEHVPRDPTAAELWRTLAADVLDDDRSSIRARLFALLCDDVAAWTAAMAKLNEDGGAASSPEAVKAQDESHADAERLERSIRRGADRLSITPDLIGSRTTGPAADLLRILTSSP